MAGAFDALLVPDFYTHVHQVLTATFVKAIGSRLGLFDEENEVLWLGARLHDIGKAGILFELNQSRNIKFTPNSEQFKIIKTHTILGDVFFKSLRRGMNGDGSVFTSMAVIARCHHERWDGNGYPDGLSGYMIPLLARIVAVVDALAAMIGPDRPYRPSMLLDDAILELKAGSGSQFDPHIIKIVLDILATHGEIV